MSRITTKFVFEPSADGQQVLKSDDVGQACYGVRHVITPPPVSGQPQQPVEQEDITIPLDSNSFEITADEGSLVSLLLAYKSKEGIWSRAHEYSFRVTAIVPPAMPGAPKATEARVFRTVRISDTAEQPHQHSHQEDQGNLVAIGEDDYVALVNGHSQLRDGAMGVVKGCDSDDCDAASATFPRSALKSKGGSGPISLNLRDNEGYTVQVISPQQEALTLSGYLDRVRGKLQVAGA